MLFDAGVPGSRGAAGDGALKPSGHRALQSRQRWRCGPEHVQAQRLSSWAIRGL